MKTCKYYYLNIENNEYNIRCPKEDCTLDKTGLCDLALQEEKERHDGLKISAIYKVMEKEFK